MEELIEEPDAKTIKPLVYAVNQCLSSKNFDMISDLVTLMTTIYERSEIENLLPKNKLTEFYILNQ